MPATDGHNDPPRIGGYQRVRPAQELDTPRRYLPRVERLTNYLVGRRLDIAVHLLKSLKHGRYLGTLAVRFGVCPVSTVTPALSEAKFRLSLGPFNTILVNLLSCPCDFWLVAQRWTDERLGPPGFLQFSIDNHPIINHQSSSVFRPKVTEGGISPSWRGTKVQACKPAPGRL